VVDSVQPEVAAGAHPIKRVVGDTVKVTARVFADGHDELAARLLYRHESERVWTEVAMQPLGNDRWAAAFAIDRLGRFHYTVRAWIDRFSTWRRDLGKRRAAGQDVGGELLIGAQLLRELAAASAERDGKRLLAFAELIEAETEDVAGRAEIASSHALTQVLQRVVSPQHAAAYGRELVVVAEPQRAAFSSWYELFPRSAAAEPGRHGTFADVIARLPYVEELGFDVLYLPPIHPIGKTARQGPHNNKRGGPADHGSPWAIGAAEGGHTAVHPQLGTIADFRRLVAAARERGIEVALDIAFQASPDHPWVREHPEWFQRRPDGSIRCAENPPKVYEDIFPLDFESEQWWGLWQALRDVFLFWIEQGVTIFRVDNPHTKSLRFWEWCIDDVKRRHPEAIFLSEAFTRPAVMHHLARVGFSQSYTYFPWRNSSAELREYLTELTKDPVRDYFRPNHWPNTPDILTEYLQHGGRPAFIARLVLAATLGANYGIYGPAFELVERTPVRPGSEEYLDSEKYQIRHWDLDAPHSLRPIIKRINRIRRDSPALQSDRGLHFHKTDNDRLICYSKATESGDDAVLVVVNLDPHHRHSGWLHLDLDEIGAPREQDFQVHDLLADTRYLFRGSGNYVELDPAVMPAHVFKVRRKVRSEADFDYYL
jgi:starch synthase (maltosyl-transferring)